MEEKHEELEPGAEVTPSLRLVDRLGGGGMGSVWTADHLALDTRVAVKFIAQGLSTDGASGARFRAEAAAAAAVKSPHVVQVLDYGLTTRGTPFIAMELLEGHDLRAHIAEHGRISPRETSIIIRQVCRALGRAHELGIVHRDVKPENVFLCNVDDDEPFVKVLDFGIAKRESGPELTTTGTTVGTPYYMSPEQLVGAKSLDQRTDLWALGVMTFYMLTGKRPFVGETAAAVAIAIHNGRLPQPTEVNPQLPRHIDAWFLKACSRDPATRFSSAKELSSSLTDALGYGRAAEPVFGEFSGKLTPASVPLDGSSDDTVQAVVPSPRPSISPTLKDPTAPPSSAATIADARSNSALSKSTAAISSPTTAKILGQTSRVPWIVAAIAIVAAGIFFAVPMFRAPTKTAPASAVPSENVATTNAPPATATATTPVAATLAATIAATVKATDTATGTAAGTGTATGIGTAAATASAKIPTFGAKIAKPKPSASAKPAATNTPDELPDLK